MSSRTLLVLGGTAGVYYYLQNHYPKVKLIEYQTKKAIAEHILYHAELNQKQLLEQENPDANNPENQETKKNQKPVQDEHIRRLDVLCDDIRSIILDRTSAEDFQTKIVSWERKAKNNQNYISKNLSNSNDNNYQYDNDDDLCAFCGTSLQTQASTDSPPQKIVFALGKKWHQNHFICCFCSKPITSKFIQNEELEEVFCAEHKDNITMCYYCHHVIPFKQGNHRMSNINHGFAQPPNSTIHVCATCESHAVNDIDTIEMLWTHLIQFFHLPREYTTIPLEMTSIDSMKRYGINQPHFLAKTVTMTIDEPRTASPQPPPQNNNNNNNTSTNKNNTNNDSNSQSPRQNNTANILNMFNFGNAYDTSRPRQAVEKVLVMQGLPMLLCLSVLAHELGHVLICTKNLLDFHRHSPFMDGQSSYSSTHPDGYPEDDLWEDESKRVMEEGICELISYIYLLSLEKIVLYGTSDSHTHTNNNNNNNNTGSINNYVRNNRFLKMILSEIDLSSLHELRRHMECNQSHIYGTGFRNALKSVVLHNYSFSSMLQYVRTHADFPGFRFGQVVRLTQEPAAPQGSRALQTVQLRAIVNNWVLDGMLISFQAASLASEVLRKTIDHLHVLYFHTKQMMKHIMRPNPEHRRLMVTAIFHNTMATEAIPRKVVRSVFINVKNTTFTQLVREIYDRFRDLLPEHYPTMRGRQLTITWQGMPVLTDADVAELTDNAFLFAEFE